MLACQLGDEELVTRLRAAHPDVAAILAPDDRRRIADSAQHNNTNAVRLMLEAGWPADARGQHNATPLHWAGYNGNAEMARLLLAHGAPADIRGDEYNGTPLDWAQHGSRNSEHCRTGDYDATIALLTAAPR